jgi:hypothetical protein
MFKRKYFNTLIIFWSLCWSVNTLTAQEVFKASDESVLKYINLDLETGTSWYGAYYTDVDGADHKLGFMQSSVKLIKTEDKNTYVFVNSNLTLDFSMASLGLESKFSYQLQDVYQATSPFNLITRIDNTVFDDAIGSSTTFIKDGELEYTSFANGKKNNLSNKNIQIGLRDVYSIDEWLEYGKPNNGEFIYANELSEQTLKSEKYTLIDTKNRIINGVQYQYFEIMTSFLDEDNNEVEFLMYIDGREWISFSLNFGGGFILNFRLEPEKRATDMSNLADFYVLNSIKIIEESQQFIDYYGYNDDKIETIWYEIIGDENALIRADYSSQHIREENGKKYLVTGAASDDYSYEQVDEEYYSTANQYMADNPELVEISKELVQQAKGHDETWSDEEEIIRVIRNYVSDLIEDEYLTEEESDPYVLLDVRKGDCTEHTDLFNALLKAAGIPARPVEGYLLADDSGTFSKHAWSEVAYDGSWVPVDATWDLWVENSTNYILTETTENFSQKKFKLKLHKINYDDGEYRVYD